MTGEPASIISQITPRQAARNTASTSANEMRSDNQRLAQELLRQAMVELDAKHFDTARRLARRAAVFGGSSGAAGFHPEQILTEIDRRERGDQVVVRRASATAPAAAAPDVRPQIKARAIELLNRGILALDEKRYGDAEQCAHLAAELHATWEQYDYKPASLLEDIQRARNAGPASQAVDPVANNPATNSPVANTALEARPYATADSHQPTEWSQRINPPAAAPLAQQAAPQQPVPTAASPAPGRTTAQAILEQAMDDLRAGRDELARLRIEQALSSIPGTTQSSPVASFGGYTAASNRPTGLTPGGIVPAAPSYAPASASSTFFPLRRDQPNVAPVAPSAADVALKPMHDPYLGDDATTTDKLSPGAQTMRETLPTSAAINPVYINRTAAPSMVPDPVQRVGYDSPAMPAAPRVQTSPDTPSLNPQVSWLEKMSTPLPPQGLPPANSYTGQQTAPQPYAGQPYPPVPQPRGYTVTPLALPPSSSATPSGSDPAIANTPDQKPGFFQKMWGAISGE